MPPTGPNPESRLAVWRPGAGATGTDRAEDGPRVRITIEPPADRAHDLLPQIEVTGLQLREITALAMDAITTANDPPTVFSRGGGLVRLRVDTVSREVALLPLAGKALRGHLARVADWFRRDPIPPPPQVVADIEATADVSGLPPLTAVVTCPTVTATGDLITRPG